ACLHAGSSFPSGDPPYAPVSETGTTSRLHQAAKQPPPYSACRPPMEAVVDCRRRTVAGRTILPPATRAQRMNDATYGAPVIRAMSAGLVRRQMRFNHRPGLVAQPEKPAHHRLHHAFTYRESDLLELFNRLIGF